MLTQAIIDLFIREEQNNDAAMLKENKTRGGQEIRPGDVGATEADFEKITVDQNIEMKFYNYNAPLSIELPEEALEASEVLSD